MATTPNGQGGGGKGRLRDRMPHKNEAWKFILGFLGIIGAALVVWYGTLYFSPDMRARREAINELEELRDQYENDTYGGETPEETLALFIQALEEGDIEQASMYFLPEDREEWENNLSQIQESGNTRDLIGDLKSREEGVVEENTARFYLVADTGTASPLVLVKNGNGVWKIRTL